MQTACRGCAGGVYLDTSASASQAPPEEEEAEAEMVPTVAWVTPPAMALPQGYAAGEDSQEKRVQSVRCSLTPPMHYGPGARHATTVQPADAAGLRSPVAPGWQRGMCLVWCMAYAQGLGFPFVNQQNPAEPFSSNSCAHTHADVTAYWVLWVYQVGWHPRTLQQRRHSSLCIQGCPSASR